MKLTKINGTHFYNMMVGASNKLEEDKNYVNSLNVFPVPDGDTGTNMSMTFKSAVLEIEKHDKTHLGEIAKKFSKGALLGARGNSGVILSQILRGISNAIKDKEEVTIKEFAMALEEGAKCAYKAVMRPTEGTVLTIIKAAGEGANISKSDNFSDFMNDICEYANKVLEMTPDMLPVLKKANVVDAGGMGLVILLRGMKEAFDGDINKNLKLRTGELKSNDIEGVFENFHVEDIKFAYCTEFIIYSTIVNPDEFREDLSEIGDSIVVVVYDDIVKVHIHTNDPGKALSMAVKKGQLSKIKIENMKEQHSNLLIDDKYIDVNKENNKMPELKKYGIVSVSPGKGISDVFKDLNVDIIVEGGQTMNPSTSDIVESIKKINAENIYIFPNNKNIIMAAEQAKEVIDKNVIVIPTKSIPQAISSLILFDPVVDVEINTTNMKDAIETVKTASITRAARDSQMDENDIKEGDILGLIEGKIVKVGKNEQQVLFNLLDELIDDDSEMITIFYGEDFDSEDKVSNIEKEIQLKYSEIDLTFLRGEQPVYSFIVGVE